MKPLQRRGRSDAEPVLDPALLVAIAGGDLGSLGILYDRHALAVWRVAYRVMGTANDVDDVVHATFLKVPSLASGFDGRPSARSWLVGIGARLALRQMRGVGRFMRAMARFAHVSRRTEDLNPESIAAGRARVAVLDRALAKLPATKRAVFVMLEMEGLTHDEVSRALGIPLPTVRTRLFHAKRALQDALSSAEDA